MDKILITGGTGFIGSHITRFYVQQGHEVRVIDNNTRGRSDRIKDVMPDVDFIEGDIQNYSVVESACKDVDTVVHLAFINGTSNFYNHPDKVLNVAIKGILTVAAAISKFRIENLILASSSEVYQTPKIYPTPEKIEMVVPELDNPRYSYGLGKIVQEFYAYHAISELINLSIFRPHNIYGSDMGDLHVIPQLFDKIISAKETSTSFKIEGSGDQTRSFCYIDDFIQGFSLISKSLNGKQVFNIGTKEEVSITDLASKIANIVGVETGHTQSEMPAGGTLRRVPDITKLEALGYKQEVTLDKGLKKYYKQLLEQD
jgi:nucleoside-diphosphate-sugar epimerase